MATLLWLEGGACSGNTMSFLNAEEPTAVDLVTDFGIEVIWHPSLGMELGEAAQQIMRDCASGARQVDILVYEGSVLTGPNGTGRYDMFAERPMQEWVAEIAPRAGVVVAVGDCSAWGGIPAMPPNPTDAIGLQYLRGERGGFLGRDFTSAMGLPVVNIPGCPAHPDWITQVVVALAAGRVGDIALDDLQRPKTFFSSFTQTGCTRVQFFEYKQSTMDFGQGTRTGCLFSEFGCRGSMTHSPCNRILWNRQSSKTRAGHPCTGCTEPGYPHGDLLPGTVFKTVKISGRVPEEFPTGTDRLTYMAHAAVARIAAPQWSKEDMFVV